ncbi:OmpA family protein [Jannaschia formosa]|uniref:OmpA family protein n=1 Tax=Jannaschia formosa TaxID=2259592 RepID=UPI000E1C17F0|nr:OmpA family protein [Jannaschia formosa]TFL19870.1 OmpA family protein [Jannaschia formosa]
MSRAKTIATLVVLAAAAGGATAAAWTAAGYIERTSRAAVTERMGIAGLTWVDVQTDGLQLILAGRAPDEGARFRAMTEAGDVVAPARLVDAIDVAATEPAAAPRFALEILRNETAVSLIGLTPERVAGGPLDTLLRRDDMQITDLVEQIDRQPPATWQPSVRFALSVLDRLPRTKISVEPGRVEITAVADSDAERRRLEAELSRTRPEGVSIALDIQAPRPVITPFTLRFVRPADAPARFEACAVDGPEAQRLILRAAIDAGFEGKADCVTGLGVPSASWGEAAAVSISALGELGAGTVTLSDADVTLTAAEGTAQALFDRVVAELETALPELFVLTAILPQPEGEAATGPTGTPEFLAIRSPEGQVQLRGRLFDEAQEEAVLAYGRARFGSEETYIATRQDDTLPEGWPARVLAAIDVLGELQQGSVTVQPALVSVRGVTGNPRADAEISRLLSDKLGAGAEYAIEVEYLEELDPALNIPSPSECEVQLNDILVEQKLTFAPGAAVLDGTGDGQLAMLTSKLTDCKRAAFEIGGHTDSQGRETMNQELSRARAEAVRLALIERGVPPAQLTARGYGETEPIASNDSEAGREANRRITFTLLGRRDAATLEAEAEARAAEPEAEPAEPDPAPAEETPEETGE